jgi:hypothetical protein
MKDIIYFFLLRIAPIVPFLKCRCFPVICDRSVVSQGTPVSTTKENDRHDMAEIVLNVALNTITIILLCRYFDFVCVVFLG